MSPQIELRKRTQTDRGAAVTALRTSLHLDDIKWMGSGLVRPECVLATSSGSLYTADWRSGVAHTKASGESAFYGAHPIDGEIIKPNGIALCGDGSFLLAHLGDTCGGVFRLQRNGETQPVFTTVDGSDLPPTNFPLLDSKGRLYVTVSTRLQPRALGYRKTCNDGFIVLQDQLGARIVADGLGYTNEIAFDAKEEWLYVNETFGRRLSRFPVAADGSLGAKQVVTEFGAGVFPDGMALDVEGNVWVVSIVSNQLLCVPPDGEHWSVLSDCDPEHLRWVESAYQNNEMGRPHLDGVKSNRLRNTSSIAFGGGDMRTAFLGCLLGDSIASIAMATAGLQPLHWNYQ